MTMTELFKNELQTVMNNEAFKEYITTYTFNSNMLNRAFFDNKYSNSIITKTLKEYLNTQEGKLALELNFDDSSSPVLFYHVDYSGLGTITYIKKEKNLLIFKWSSCINSENTEIITYDFITKTLSKEIELKNIVNQNDVDTLFYMSIIYNKKCVIPEWIFSYITDLKELSCLTKQDNWISNYLPFEMPLPCDVEYIEQCPKGFINYIKENHISITYEHITEYVVRKEFGNIGYSIFKRTNGTLSKEDIHLIVEKKGLITKVVKNSWVADALYISFDTILQLIQEYKCILDTKVILSLLSESDTRKTFSQKLYNIKEANMNRVLAEKLQRLNFMHRKVFGEYTVIIPQNIKDLQKEGDAQHNCVGHYYNDSIIQDRNLIYFIRRNNNIDKSFVTCRYSLTQHGTVEARAFANKSISREIHSLIYNSIDTFIQESL